MLKEAPFPLKVLAIQALLVASYQALLLQVLQARYLSKAQHPVPYLNSFSGAKHLQVHHG